eukprot:jgi/Mesvir1/13681/Mv02118-RA.1
MKSFRARWLAGGVVLCLLVAFVGADTVEWRNDTIDVFVFSDPPFVNILETDPNAPIGSVINPKDIREHMLNMPKYGYALSFFNLLALREDLSYRINMTFGTAGEICANMVEDMLDLSRTELAVAIVPLPRLIHSAEYEAHPCDRYFHLKRIPFYESGLVLVTPRDAQLKLKSASVAFFDAMKKPSSVNAVCLLLLGVIVSGHIIWLLEKRRNPFDFPKEYIKGVHDGCWFSVVTALTVGYGDKVPRTGLGRTFAFIWMFIGVFISAFFNGTITSEMTSFQGGDVLQGLSDIQDSDKVGAPAPLLEIVKGMLPRTVSCGPSVKRCEEQLSDGDIDIMIADYPSVVQFLATNKYIKGRYQLVGDIFKESSVYDYNLVVNSISEEGSALYNKLLKAVYSLEGTAAHRRMDSTYFGDLQFSSEEDSAGMYGSGGDKYNWGLVAFTIFLFCLFPMAKIINLLKKLNEFVEPVVNPVMEPVKGKLRRFKSFGGREWFFFPGHHSNTAAPAAGSGETTPSPPAVGEAGAAGHGSSEIMPQSIMLPQRMPTFHSSIPTIPETGSPQQSPLLLPMSPKGVMPPLNLGAGAAIPEVPLVIMDPSGAVGQLVPASALASLPMPSADKKPTEATGDKAPLLTVTPPTLSAPFLTGIPSPVALQSLVEVTEVPRGGVVEGRSRFDARTREQERLNREAQLKAEELLRQQMKAQKESSYYFGS